MALHLPIDGEPVVVRAEHWSPAVIAAVIGAPATLAVPLDWTPSDQLWLLLFSRGDGQGSINPASRALAGAREQPLRGDLLLLGMGSDVQAVGLTVQDLLLISTRLLVAEAAAGELAMPGS